MKQLKTTGIWVLLLAATSLFAAQPRKELKPGFNLFSPDQDIQMGKEAAAEVYKTMPVIQNDELSSYLTRIGQRLAKSKRAGQFPFVFAVINDPSVNAFALPGGPMFVHTALITAADNESQLAGVLAHEMSHVALRHGTHEASKKNLLQLPAMLGGSLLGPGSLWGSLGQMGINLASGSVLLTFSRAAESEADLNGTRMMNDAGYDPHEMARFFEKLQKQGSGGGDGKLAKFLSDHPAPGDRVKAVDDEIPFLPTMNYQESEPQTFLRAKEIVANLGPSKQPPAAVPDSGAQAFRPSGSLSAYSDSSISMNYPSNWKAMSDAASGTVTFADPRAVIADSGGQGRLTYGAVASFYVPRNGAVDLERDTAAVLSGILQGSPDLRKAAEPRPTSVGVTQALITQLQGPSAFAGETESITLVTEARPEGLLYLIFVVPQSEVAPAQAALDAMLNSLR